MPPSSALASRRPQLTWLLLLASWGSVVSATSPPATRIDLNTFDNLRQTVALPDGETLAYISLGDATGLPVVLIHGFTDNARDWVPLVPYLSPHFHLILVDIRGHGHSGKPECCYTRVDFAYDIKLLLDSLGIQRADFVGHSLGGVIAQTLAEFWSERTRRVVLISSSAGPRPGAAMPKALAGYFDQIRELKDPIDPDSPFMVGWWSSPTPVDADFLRRQRRDSAAIPARVWQAVLDQGLDPMLEGGELQRTLPRLTAPTLLIWGSKDPLITEDARQTLREGLPQAQVKVFEGLGHNPFWEDPQGCAAVINQFLSAASHGGAAKP